MGLAYTAVGYTGRISLLAYTTNREVSSEIDLEYISVGIEMQFQCRYQSLFWLCISIDIEIICHTVISVIVHLIIFQLL